MITTKKSGQFSNNNNNNKQPPLATRKSQYYRSYTGIILTYSTISRTDGEEEEASEPEVDDHGDGGWDYEESHASDNGPEVSDDQSDVDEGSESGFTLELPPQSSDTSTET